MKNTDHLTSQNRRLRQSQFFQLCRQISRRSIADGTKLSARQIVDIALKSPAPSYYVEYTYALRRLSRPLPTGTRCPSPRNLMWNEISRRVNNRRQNRPNLSLGQALSLILAEGNASSFFISPAYALRLYYRLLSQKRRSPHP